MSTYDDDDSTTFFDIPRPAPAPKNPTPDIADVAYKHSIVDSKKTPIESIVSYIGGSNWPVDYYSQYHNVSEELKAFDPSQLDAYQSYVKINRFILKLQGALSQDDERDTGRFNITGQAIVQPLPNMTPNVGDAFIADIGEGSAGQFTVTEIRQLTNNLATAYEVTFRMDRLVDKRIETLLNSKVIKELYFRKDYLLTGENPLLTTEAFNYSRRLDEELRIISARFTESFFNYEANTLLIPGMSEYTYDPFVVRGVINILEGISPITRRMVEYNVDDWRIPTLKSVYDMMYHQDSSLLYSCFRGYAVLPTNLLQASMYQNVIRYSTIKNVVVPRPLQDHVDNYSQIFGNLDYAINTDVLSGSGDCDKNPLDSIVEKEATPCCNGERVINTVDDINLEKLINGMDVPDVGGTTYIMSQSFFDKELFNCTLFERMCWNVIDRKTLDVPMVLEFATHYHKWKPLQQYYLAPLLLIMLRAAMKGL